MVGDGELKLNRSAAPPRKWIDYLIICLKGFGMGTADIIPGISGGTIAFITGIYEEFIESIKSFDFRFLRLLFQLKIKDAFSRVHWQFLAAVLSGIAIAILSLAKIISWLMTDYPVLVYSFFFGLIMPL